MQQHLSGITVQEKMSDVSVLMQKSRTWMVTTFVPESTADLMDALLSTLAGEKCKFIGSGREHCPTTGRFHMHIAMKFHNLVYGYEIQEMLGERANLKIGTKGTTRLLEYYRKCGTWREWGDIPEIVDRPWARGAKHWRHRR